MSLPIIQTIQNNIDNLKLTKANIKNAVNTDYDFINNEQIESYPNLIEQGIAYYKNRIPHATKEGTDLSFNSIPLKFDNMTIKGNTEQKSYTGKNLFKVGGSRTQYGMTGVQNADGSITISGTATTSGNAEVFVPTGSSSFPAGTYTFSLSHSLQAQIYIHPYIDSEATTNFSIPKGETSNTRTYSQDITKFSIRFTVAEGETYNETVFIQLEQGEEATDYEPYTGSQPSPNPDYPQEIKVVTGNNVVKYVGKNKFNYLIESNYINSGNSSLSKIENGIRITTHSTGINRFASVNLGNIEKFVGKSFAVSYIAKPSAQNTSGFRIYYLNSSKQLTDMLTDHQSSGGVFTVPANPPVNAKYLALVLYANVNGTVVPGNYIDYTNIQIEEDSTATPYEPYREEEYKLSLGTIELCKIDNYQDYIYKENGNWYKYEAVGEVTFIGNESWVMASATDVKRFVCNTLYNTVIPENQATVGSLLSDKFIARTANNTSSNVQGIAIGATGKFVIYCEDTKNYNSTQFKEWLSNNNVTVYYALGTPTSIQITDPMLISQLEALDKVKGNNGTTITTTGNDLAPVLNFTAYLKEAE